MVRKSTVPRIGVTWVTHGSDTSDRYIRAVEHGGGIAIGLRANAGRWLEELRELQGVLFTGGADVDPRIYGEDNAGLSKGTNRQRDEWELEALHFCLDHALPVLAICRGLQLVNAALGGALIQDIESAIRHGKVGDESSYHDIEVKPGNRLAQVVGGGGMVRVNSRHHQGVDLPRVAQKLIVTALAPDGIVEGLELVDAGQFLVAVQCHPEYLDDVPMLNQLFASFVAVAAGR